MADNRGASRYDPEAVRAKYLAERDKRLLPGRADIRDLTRDELVRVAILSTKGPIGIAEYPDSDKVGVWAHGTHYMLRRANHLDYWDGEGR